MSVCQSCGRPTFGRFCGVCQEFGKREGPLIRVKHDANRKALDIVYSPPNGAWVILSVDSDPKRVKLLGIKSTVEELQEFVDNY